nr:MAG TPA: hypothetical protein [Caudoviricetes sp.]
MVLVRVEDSASTISFYLKERSAAWLNWNR